MSGELEEAISCLDNVDVCKVTTENGNNNIITGESFVKIDCVNSQDAHDGSNSTAASILRNEGLESHPDQIQSEDNIQHLEADSKDLVLNGDIKDTTCLADEIIIESAIDRCKLDEHNINTMDNISSSSLDNVDNTNERILNNDLSRTFTTSSVSLNENNDVQATACKTPISKSVENIPLFENLADKCTSLSSKHLDSDKILEEFSNQKIKVAATQKISQEHPNPNFESANDTRISRLNRDVITHDLGSIVKNVHGIFWSVSGSLKSAYNISHKASTQFKYPANKTVAPPKNLVSGRQISDIFEDESVAEISTPDKENELQSTETEDHCIAKSDSATPAKHVEEENDATKDVVKLQVESLERMLAEQRKEMVSLRDRVRQQADELRERDQTFKDLEGKMDLMCKRVEQADREKDAAVMRYAGVECAAIEARGAAEAARRGERAARAEADLLGGKLKSAHGEKQRICQLYDDKCHELSNTERELTKLREDLKELDGRLKWTQSKLRLEMDVNKESAERVERLSQQVTELEAARDSAAANATDSLRARQLESDLKESQASLIMCRHDKEELERRFTAVSVQLEHCKRDLEETKSSLAEHKTKVEHLSTSNLRLEEEAASLAGLRAQASLADNLAAQLQRESERAATFSEELGRERARADTCARREAAALQHAASVTAAHVAASADGQRARDMAQALSADNTSLRERLTTLEADVSRLEVALADETERRNKENRVLARKIAELTEELNEANQQLEWEKGENAVLKKKNASAIKEMNRELQRALKRCEQLEAKIAQLEPDASTRTGSVTSLSSGESATMASHDEHGMQNGHATDAMPDIQVREPDRQALVERIVSLQRAAARRSDRCEFLEEHSRHLTAELRRKSRLLRHTLCHLPAGALAPADTDRNKKRKLTKKEIARLGGGAMAAVWGGDPAGMTLDLSIEMNKRLQAVLEDTLLKNITLKENMDTLGEEIARLKGQTPPNTTK